MRPHVLVVVPVNCTLGYFEHLLKFAVRILRVHGVLLNRLLVRTVCLNDALSHPLFLTLLLVPSGSTPTEVPHLSIDESNYHLMMITGSNWLFCWIMRSIVSKSAGLRASTDPKRARVTGEYRLPDRREAQFNPDAVVWNASVNQLSRGGKSLPSPGVSPRSQIGFQPRRRTRPEIARNFSFPAVELASHGGGLWILLMTSAQRVAREPWGSSA